MYYREHPAESQDVPSAADDELLPPALYKSAERAFFGLLRRKRMSREFIERHGDDLFARALFEYVRTVRAGKEIRKPVAWIVLCAWHRTIRELESRDWRPRMVSTESIGELPAGELQTPEHDFLSRDRYRKVREAVERLSEDQRALLARSYFEGKSVREAGRQLGWSTSKAQRVHEAAQRRLRKLLRVDHMDDLETVAGLAALLSFGLDGCARMPRLIGAVEEEVDVVLQFVTELAERGLHQVTRLVGADGSTGRRPAAEGAEALGEVGRRAVVDAHGPVGLVARAGRRASDLGRRVLTSGGAETTTVAADGGTRVAEACKVVAAACVIGTSAVTGGVALIGNGHQHRTPKPHSHVASSLGRIETPIASQVADPVPRSVTAANLGSRRGTSVTNLPQPPENTSARVSSGDELGKQSPAQHRSERRQEQESTVDAEFGVSQVAAREEEEWRDGVSRSGAAVGTEATSLSTASGKSGTQTSAAPPANPKLASEERQVETQFRGALP